MHAVACCGGCGGRLWWIRAGQSGELSALGVWLLVAGLAFFMALAVCCLIGVRLREWHQVTHAAELWPERWNEDVREIKHELVDAIAPHEDHGGVTPAIVTPTCGTTGIVAAVLEFSFDPVGE